MNEGTIPFTPDTMEDKPLYRSPYDTISMVKDFMLLAGQEVKPSPGQPSADVLKLRLSIILEETMELAEAFGLSETFGEMMLERSITKDALEYLYSMEDTLQEGSFLLAENSGVYNQVEVLDALLDGRYVADGTMLACGLQDAFYEGFANVQESNLSKFPSTMDEAAQTSVHYKQQGVDTTWGAHGGKWPVKRASDSKILKSILYTPANLAPILEKYSLASPSSGDNV